MTSLLNNYDKVVVGLNSCMNLSGKVRRHDINAWEPVQKEIVVAHYTLNVLRAIGGLVVNSRQGGPH